MSGVAGVKLKVVFPRPQGPAAPDQIEDQPDHELGGEPQAIGPKGLQGGGNFGLNTHANKLGLLHPQQTLGLLEGDQTLLDPMALGNLDDDALLG